MPILIRPIQPDDAETIMVLFDAIDRETKYLLFEPGERTRGPAEWRQHIEKIRGGDSPDEIFVAADEDAPHELAGVFVAIGDTRQRLRHSASLVVAVRQAYSGRGVATRLFAALEEWARARGDLRTKHSYTTIASAASSAA